MDTGFLAGSNDALDGNLDSTVKAEMAFGILFFIVWVPTTVFIAVPLMEDGEPKE